MKNKTENGALQSSQKREFLNNEKQKPRMELCKAPKKRVFKQWKTKTEHGALGSSDFVAQFRQMNCRDREIAVICSLHQASLLFFHFSVMLIFWKDDILWIWWNSVCGRTPPCFHGLFSGSTFGHLENHTGVFQVTTITYMFFFIMTSWLWIWRCQWWWW